MQISHNYVCVCVYLVKQYIYCFWICIYIRSLLSLPPTTLNPTLQVITEG